MMMTNHKKSTTPKQYEVVVENIDTVYEEHVRTLITALWDFIENVNDETPDRTDRFFALREQVRNYFAQEGTEQ